MVKYVMCTCILFIAPSLFYKQSPNFEDETLFFLCSSHTINLCSVSGKVLENSRCLASLRSSSGMSDSSSSQFGPQSLPEIMITSTHGVRTSNIQIDLSKALNYAILCICQFFCNNPKRKRHPTLKIVWLHFLLQSIYATLITWPIPINKVLNSQENIME